MQELSPRPGRAGLKPRLLSAVSGARPRTSASGLIRTGQLSPEDRSTIMDLAHRSLYAFQQEELSAKRAASR